MTHFHTLREGIEHLFAQGLHFVPAAELEGLAQELAAQGLSQPAAMMRQVEQHVTEGKPGAEDAGILTKILQVLAQADIQLSQTATLDLKGLQKLDTYHSLHIDAETAEKQSPLSLDEIIAIDESLPQSQALIRFFETASYEELAKSIELVWFDYSLSPAIVKGLADRGENALKLAQSAFKYKKNMVIQRTAIELLKTLGGQEALRAEALEILRKQGQKAKEPMSWYFEEAFAELEGRSAEFREARQQRLIEKQHDLQNLNADKKAVRKRAINALAKTKDPCFATALLPLLDDPLGDIAIVAMKALHKIGGFEAIPLLAHKVKADSNHSAAEVLYKFGDKRGLQYFLGRKVHFALERYVPLSDYGLLAVAPILHMVRTLDRPEDFPDGFFHIFSLFRSKDFARKVLDHLKKDELLAQKFVTLLQAVYPRQSEKILKATENVPLSSCSPEALEKLVHRTLAEDVHQHVARLRQQKLVQTILVTPDGSEAVTLGMNGLISIWHTESWKLKHSFTLQRKYYHVHQIALSPDAKFFISTNNVEKTVELWEFGHWEKSLATLKHHEGICSVGFSSDGQSLLAGGLSSIIVWDLETRGEIAQLRGHSNCVEAIKALPGQHRIVTGDRNGLLLIWDDRTWQKITELKVEGTIQNSIDCSPDGCYMAVIERLASYSATTVKIWETDGWQELAAPRISNRIPICSLAFSPDSKFLLCGSNELRILDVATCQVQLTLANTDARAIAVTPDRKYVIAGAEIWQIDWSDLE